METWENVLILGLVSISVIVLMNHNISLDLIPLLDNSLFQLTIVGLTLAIAVYSPPVAIVAIATIVIVYYVRNLIKVQLINDVVCNDSEEIRPDNEPRLIMEEVKTVETTTTTQHIKIQEGDNLASNNKTCRENTNVVQVKTNEDNQMVANDTNTKPEDNDVLENALKENHYRVGQMHIQNYKIPGVAPVPAIKPIVQDNFPDPRTCFEGFNVNSTDPSQQVFGPAPTVGSTNFISGEDSNNGLFKGPTVPIEYNEMSAQPTNRLYSNNEGQYMINQDRPYSSPQKYEVADFMPGNDLGKNDFTPLGNSIDDKITNLKKGFVSSMTAPPDFNIVTPERMN